MIKHLTNTQKYNHSLLSPKNSKEERYDDLIGYNAIKYT